MIPRGAESGASLALWYDERLLFAVAGAKFDCPQGELFYMGIGGHRLCGEDLATCAVREAREEIGVDVNVVDSHETWLISEDGEKSRLELEDLPRPLALYAMAAKSRAAKAPSTYYIAIYSANLSYPPSRLQIEEVRAVLALTPDQVVLNLGRRLTLGELTDEGALVIAPTEEIHADVQVYPIGSARALAHVLRDTVSDR